MVIATITHPLVGYETETVVWARLLRQGDFQPTIASAYGLGHGWGGIWPSRESRLTHGVHHTPSGKLATMRPLLYLPGRLGSRLCAMRSMTSL